MPDPNMMPPMGRGGGDSLDKLQGMRSVFNPTDMKMMAQEGQISKDMTVEQFLGQFGVSPQDPVTKLADVFAGQAKNADPLNKMKAIAGGAGSASPQGGPPQGAAPQGPPPGLDGLLG